MGVLLSRFRAVIFPRSGRMVSGGICSEPVGPVPDVAQDGNDDDNATAAAAAAAVHRTAANLDVATAQATGTDAAPEDDRLYYGLHWRKELNWRALGFEFVEETDGVDGHEGVTFHA